MDSYRWKLVLVLLGLSAVAGAQSGQYNTIRSYQTLSALNTVACTVTNPPGLPEAAVVNDTTNNGIYWCSGTNVWTPVSSGGGGGGNPGGNIGDFQYKSSSTTFAGLSGLNFNSSAGQFNLNYTGTGVTSNGNLFNITDTTANQGTGFQLNVDTAAGTPGSQSAAQSFRVGFLGNSLLQIGLVGGTTNGLGMAVFGDQWPLANLAFTGNSSKVTIGINNNAVTALNVFGNYVGGAGTQKGLLSLRTNGGSATTDYFMEALYGCGTVTDATCGSGTLAYGLRRDSMMVLPSITTPVTNPPSGYYGVYVDSSCTSGAATLSSTGTKTCLGSGGGGGAPPGGPTGSPQFNTGSSTFGGMAGQVYAQGMVCDGITDDRANLQTVLTAATYGETVIIPNTTTGCYINIQQQKINTIAFSANTVTLTMAATANTAFVTNGLARITGLTSADSANYNLFPGVWKLASVSGTSITFTLTNSTTVTTFNPANAFLSIGVWLTTNGVSVVCGSGATNIWSAAGSQGACNLFTTPSNALSTATSQGDIFTTAAFNGPYFRGVYAIDNQGGQGVGYARTAMGGFYIQNSQTYAFDQSGAMGFTCLGNPNEQGCGAGITLDGGSPNGNYAPTQNTTSFVQYGTMVNPELIADRYPITTRGRSSDLKVYGGVMSCLLPTALTKAVLIPNSIGWDQGYTWGKKYYSGSNAANEGGGNWAYGTAVSQCQVGYALQNSSNNGFVGKAEDSTALGPYPDSIAGIITSTNNTNTSASRINNAELHIVGYNTGILEDANSQNQNLAGYQQTQCSGNSFSGAAYSSGSPNNCGGQISTIGAIGTGGSSGGSSWAVGDWFQLNGTVCVATGGPGVVALGRILTVSSGAATAVAIMTRGSQYAACTGTAETAAALGASTGTGLSVNITAVATSGINQGISTTTLASNGVVTGDFSITGSMLQDSGPANDTIRWFPTLDANSSPANVTASTGSSLIQPPSDVVPLTVQAPSTGTPTSDVFDVYANISGTLTKCLSVLANGNVSTCGNNQTYGVGGQSTQSFIRGYGSATPNPFYIESLNGATGGVLSSIFCSITVQGLCGESSNGSPSVDLGAGTAFTTNPMTASGDLIYGGSTYGSLTLVTPTRLGIGGNGTVLFSNGSLPGWGTPATAGVMSSTLPTTVVGATSGGIPCFTSTTTMTTSVLLGTNGIVTGGGAGACPTASTDFTIGSLGSSTLGAVTSGAVIDFSASHIPMKVPSVSAAVTTADAQLIFDSATSAKNYHAFANGADAIVLTSPVANLVNGHCLKSAVGISGNVQLVDTGSACGSGGATALSAISAATATNTITSGNNGSQIWQWDLTSNTQAAWELGENVASTNGTYTNGVPNQVLGEFSTIAGSTASPLLINNSLSGSQTSCALCLNPTWNTTGVVDAGIFMNVTNTASAGGSKVIDLQVGNTTEFNVTNAGVLTANGAGSFQGLVSSTVGLGSTTNTGAIKVQCGTDNTTGTAGCTNTIRGLNITGGSTANTLAGWPFVVGGSNAGTVSTAIAGPAGIASGVATGNASATQGSLSLLDAFAQAGTVTLWNLECYSSTTTKTVTDCGASPTNIAGVAQNLQGGTTAVTVAQVGSDVPVNLSAAGTVNDTVCAGSTAGKLTDSGGTAPCTAGITVGTIVSVSATPTWRGADGSTATLSTTLALVHLARLNSVGAGDGTGLGTVTSIATTSPITGGTITSTGTIACATCVTSAASLTSTAFMTGAGSQASQTPSATATLTSGGAPTFPGAGTFSAAGAASTPGLTVSGAPYTAGTSTTNFPQTYLNSGASPPTTFSTAGTVFGMNAPSGFTGNFEYMCVNGANPCPFQVTYQGNEIITQTASTQFALNIQNTTAATSSTAQSSPFDIRSGTAWYNPEASTASPPVAAASVQDCWSHQILETNGSNGTSIYNLVHNNAVDTCTGSPSVSYVQVPFQNSWGVQTNALAQASAPTVAAQGATGAASWSYAIVACIGESCSNVSTATQITNGNATLTTSNWNKVTWTATTNADFYKVYRTQVGTSPTTLGTICLIPAGVTLECDDKALTGDATTAQVYNATGQVYVGTGPSVGGGSGGGMFATAGTVPTTLVSSAAGWYANSTTGNFDIVNGTADWGYATGVVGKTSQKAETGSADANVLTVTPVAVAGTYRVNIAISVSSATSGVIGWTATWKDSNGNAQTPVELTLFQNGTAAPALTYTTSAAGNYHGDAILDIDNSATNIVIKWIGGGTTAAKMTAVLERIN